MNTREELLEDLERMLRGEQPSKESVNTVHDVPDQFKEWVEKNEERIARAEERGTLPYFLRDNEKAWKGQPVPQYGNMEGAKKQVSAIVATTVTSTPRTKQELESITFVSDKPLFTQIKKECLRNLKSEGGFYDNNQRYYTHRMCLDKDKKEGVFFHCWTGLELKAAEKLQQILPTLSGGKYVPIDMSRKNYKEKIARGVLHFTLI